MPTDPSITATSAISLGQTITAYSFFLPSLQEVRRSAPADSDMQADVRMGQFAAAGLSIGVGMMLTNLTGSWTPFWVAVFIAAIIASSYEVAMRSERLA